MTVSNIIVAVLTVLALVAVFYGRKNALKLAVTEFMLLAEQFARDEIIEQDGLTKMNAVMQQIMLEMPADIRAVLTVVAALTGKDLQQFMEDLVQIWYDTIVAG